jgi:YggT family protein
MEIFGNLMRFLLEATAEVLNLVLNLYLFIVIARALISWVNPDPYNPIVRFLYTVTEPLLSRVRRWLMQVGLAAGGLDLSPIVVIVAIYFLQAFLVKSLNYLAGQLG